MKSSLISARTFFFSALQTAFLLGILEGLWEWALLENTPLKEIFWNFPLLFFSGGLWFVFGLIITLGFFFTRRILNRRYLQDSDLHQISRVLGALTIGFAILAVARMMKQPPFMSLRLLGFALLVLSVVGWYVFGGIQRGWLGLCARKKRLAHQLQILNCLVLAAVFFGWMATVIQKTGWGESFWGSQARSARAGRSSNILILVIDALRPDHMSLYGYPKPTTPFIDEFSREGSWVFRDCQANATWTRPSVQNIVTGKLAPKTYGRNKILSADEATLFERFHQAGYQTGWFVANPYASTEHGVPQQANEFLEPKHTLFFENFLVAGWILRQVRGHKYLHRMAVPFEYWGFFSNAEKPRPRWIKDDELRDAFLKWVDRLPPREPWIAYLHLMSVHAPYGDTQGFKLGPIGNEKYSLCKLDAPARDRREVEQYIEAYDLDISYADSKIREILTSLKQREDWERTVVVITADHGEEFGEHGLMGHAEAFHRGVTHVPLMIRIPHQKKLQWIDAPIQLIDLLPTFLALAGLARDPSLDGKDVSRMVRGFGQEEPRPIYHASSTSVQGLRWGRYQIYASVTKGKASFALYDLRRDPAEKTNLAAKYPERTNQLIEKLTKLNPNWSQLECLPYSGHDRYASQGRW